MEWSRIRRISTDISLLRGVQIEALAISRTLGLRKREGGGPMVRPEKNQHNMLVWSWIPQGFDCEPGHQNTIPSFTSDSMNKVNFSVLASFLIYQNKEAVL